MNENDRTTFKDVKLLGLAYLSAILLSLNYAMRSKSKTVENKMSNAESPPLRYVIISNRAQI